MQQRYERVPLDGLSAYIPLNGNATYYDNATNGSTTPTAVTYVPTSIGYQRRCGLFDGSTSKIVVNPFSTSNTTKSVSVRCRALGVANTGDGKVFDFRDASSRLILLSRDNTTGFSIAASCGTQYSLGSLGLMTNERHHRVITMYGGTAYYYLDGKLIGSGSCGTTAWSASNGRIGNERNDGASRFFNGNIQGFRAYNRGLTQSDVSILYREGLRQLGGFSDGILANAIGFWDMSGDANETLTGAVSSTVPSTTSDRFGIANSAYNTTSQNITTPHTANLNPLNGSGSTKIGMGSFFKCTGNGVVVAKSDGIGYMWFRVNSGNIVFEGSASGQGRFFTTTTGLTLANGSWNFVYCEYDKEGRTSKIYVNGVLSVTGGMSSGIVNTTGPRYLGSSNAGSLRLPGAIDDVVIFDTLLTVDQIRNLYQVLLRKEPQKVGSGLPPYLKNGLQMWFPGNVLGTTIYDLGSSPTNGTLSGTPVSRRVSNQRVIEFNGSSQYFQRAHSSSITPGSGSFTIACWFKGTNTTEAIIMRKDFESGSPRNFYQLALSAGSAGYVYFNQYRTTSSGTVSSPGGFNDGERHLAVGVRDATGSTMRLYIDGILVGTSNVAAANIDNTGVLSFGRYTESAGGYLNGGVANPMYRNRVLSQQEILSLFYNTFIM